LLDEQGRRGSLVAAERREAEALVNIATTHSILKLARLRLRPKTTRPKTTRPKTTRPKTTRPKTTRPKTTRPKTQDEEFDLTIATRVYTGPVG
jgi:heme-binding NEAT domain protein